MSVKSDWFISFLILIVFLLTNGYQYNWDDQHVEIPLLKSLIDPSLFVGDYYVESLKKNFTSFMYPLLARLITVEQVPGAYLVLYLLSRYFLFFWLYKIWKQISRSLSFPNASIGNPQQVHLGTGPEEVMTGPPTTPILAFARKHGGGGDSAGITSAPATDSILDSCRRTSPRLTAFLCVVMLILIGRVPEFLYRTFSHQEFALGIVFAGIYFFYKERFVLASAILGCAVNFHALYALFPMVYLGIFLMLDIKKYKFTSLVKSSFAFLICALPFLIWTAKRLLSASATDSGIYENWYTLYQIACPQNFLFLEVPLNMIFKDFKSFEQAIPRYLIIIVLYILNFVHNETFRKDKKSTACALATVGLLTGLFFFSYVQPNRLILDFNLARSTQYLLLFLMGYTTILLLKVSQEVPLWVAALLGMLFYLLGFGDVIATLAALAMIFLITAVRVNRILSFCLFLCSIVGSTSFMIFSKFKPAIFIKLYNVAGLLLIGLLVVSFLKKTKKFQLSSQVFIIIPLVLTFVQFGRYHWEHWKAERYAAGFWQLQRDWEDMQRFVRDHTPKNALLLVPNDMEMGGFRILSERKIVCCYRDCGIVGFDYKAALEWKKRLADIEAFKVIATDPLKPAIMNALFKYKVNYIVFMRYYAPDQSMPGLQKIYENGKFSLFEVNPSTIPAIHGGAWLRVDSERFILAPSCPSTPLGMVRGMVSEVEPKDGACVKSKSQIPFARKLIYCKYFSLFVGGNYSNQKSIAKLKKIS